MRSKEVAAIRDYTTQLQRHVEGKLEGDARADALAVVQWARAYPGRIDPLRIGCEYQTRQTRRHRTSLR